MCHIQYLDLDLKNIYIKLLYFLSLKVNYKGMHNDLKFVFKLN